MSKRYGRNQKRKHREKISELERSISLTKQNNHDLRKQAEQRKSTIEQIFKMIERVTEYSVILPPKKLQDHYKRDRYDLPYFKGSSPLIEEMSSPTGSLAQIATVDRISLYLLEEFIEDNREQVAKAVYMKYYGPDGKEVGYMLSKAAIAIMSDAVIKDTAIRIARELLSKVYAPKIDKAYASNR